MFLINPYRYAAAVGTIALDDFNDNSQATALWDTGTPGAPFTQDALVTVAESSGQLRITPRSSFASAAYNGYTSDNSYNLTDKSVQVEVVDPGAANDSRDTRLVMYADSSNYIAMYELGSTPTIFMRVRRAGANDETTLAYVNATHRFWRIRHQTSGGHIFFDTSPDGVTWTNRRDSTGPSSILPTVTAMKVVLVSGTFASVASPGVAVFDNFSSSL